MRGQVVEVQSCYGAWPRTGLVDTKALNGTGQKRGRLNPYWSRRIEEDHQRPAEDEAAEYSE